MKKRRLEIDYSYDFELLGIISPLKGYKLAWEINNRLELKLTKKEDLSILTKSKEAAHFSHFVHQVESTILRLFRNKPGEEELAKTVLVPEFPHFDFIMLVQSEDTAKSKRLQEVLRMIPSVELVAFIPLPTLKAKDNFIF